MVKFRWEKDFKETILGRIPKDWCEKLIKEIGDVGGGSTPSTKIKEYWDGDVAWITPDDLAKHKFRYISHGKRNITEKAVKDHSLRIYPSGTILLTSRAPIGYLAIAMNPVTTNQGFKNIVPNDGTNSEFLYYLLKNIVEYLRDIAGGSTFSELTATTLREVKVPFPDSREQSRIAIILSVFDSLIENKIRQNEVLEEVAMAVFKNWFVDFEPFRDGEFEHSELGEIPKQFYVKPLEEVATLSKGVSYSSSEISSEPQGSLFITLNNFLREGGFKLEYDYYIGSKAREEQKVKEGDLIIALTDMTPLAKVVGSPAIVCLPYGYDFGIISLDCGKLQFPKECLRFYLYLYLKHTQEENATFANGVNVLHLNTNLFMRNKLISVPPEPFLEKFHSLVEPLFRKIALNQKQILVLRKVRDTLLPLLVSGKLRVEET